MKSRSFALITAIVITTALVSGCMRHFAGGVKGSGVRQTQKREVSPFKAVHSEGAFQIDIVCQKDQSVEVEGDDNILPLISTEVSNNVLRIRPVKGYNTEDPIRIKITVPNLEAVTGSGAGTIDVAGLKNDKFEVQVNGAPTVRLNGETKVLSVDTNGAGKIDTHKLRASEVTVDSKGVSRVEVYASDKLNVTISGPSHVIYEGDPEINQTINGPGKLEKRESQGA
jgi:Putative auto-transporter adhesin, head GIN domain